MTQVVKELLPAMHSSDNGTDSPIPPTNTFVLTINPTKVSPRLEVNPVTVMSYNHWQQQWNSDPSIIGKDVILNDTAFTIVGVTPPEFFGERVRRSPDFWIPLAFQPQIELRPSYIDRPNAYWLLLIGRLAPGAKLD